MRNQLAEQWQLALLLAVLAANVALSYHVYRALRREYGGGENGEPRTARSGGEGAGTAPRQEDGDGPLAVGDPEDYVDREAGVVQCPTCGTENEVGYRYCRSCVGELPAAMGFDRAPSNPFGRMT